MGSNLKWRAKRLPPASLLLVAILTALVGDGCAAVRTGRLLLSTPTPTPAPTATASPTSTPTPTATPTLTATPTSTPTATATATSTPTPTSTPSPVAVSPLGTPPPCPDSGPLPPSEGCPPSLLTGRRLVAFYGIPDGGGLGALGRHDITTTLTLLSGQAQAYQELDPAAQTIPTFHMVVTIADAGPGDDGDYNHSISHETIRRWIDGARASGAWVILDIQPGRADLDAELDFVEPFLREHDVHLAVDPEFLVSDAQVPGADLGRIGGPQVNRVQARLDAIARDIGQRKILVIHQFNDRMITQKECILDYPCVDLVWDADGFGWTGAKTSDYVQYSREPGFEYGGFKLFYDLDTPLMTPQEVLALDPPPAVVIYQ